MAIGASAAAERFLNIEVECGLLMAIGDGNGEEGMSVFNARSSPSPSSLSSSSRRER